LERKVKNMPKYWRVKEMTTKWKIRLVSMGFQPCVMMSSHETIGISKKKEQKIIENKSINLILQHHPFKGSIGFVQASNSVAHANP